MISCEPNEIIEHVRLLVALRPTNAFNVKGHAGIHRCIIRFLVVKALTFTSKLVNGCVPLYGLCSYRYDMGNHVKIHMTLYSGYEIISMMTNQKVLRWTIAWDVSSRSNGQTDCVFILCMSTRSPVTWPGILVWKALRILNITVEATKGSTNDAKQCSRGRTVRLVVDTFVLTPVFQLAKNHWPDF